jgi:hypothetical protein
MKKHTTKWYAATDDVQRMGPYSTMIEAWRAVRLTVCQQYARGRLHAKGSYVWPESTEQSCPRRDEDSNGKT